MARWTASGSIPSTLQLGMPKPGPRADSRGSPVASSTRGGHRVLVVLDEEADRQLPGRGEVEGLQRGADVDGAVAEVGDRDGVGAGLPVRPRGARRPAARRRRRWRWCRSRRPRATAGACEPPRPWLKPRSRPQISASVRSSDRRARRRAASRRGRCPWARRACSALARNWWWPRWEPLTVSSLVSASTEPTAPPSWPMLECAGPWIRPVAGELEDVLLEGPDQHQLAEHAGEQVRVGGVPVVVGRRRARPTATAGSRSVCAAASASPPVGE